MRNNAHEISLEDCEYAAEEHYNEIESISDDSKHVKDDEGDDVHAEEDASTTGNHASSEKLSSVTRKD